MRLRRTSPGQRRRGIILLVVLVMLTLFAIAGLTFVLYADAASESARLNRGAEPWRPPTWTPTSRSITSWASSSTASPTTDGQPGSRPRSAATASPKPCTAPTTPLGNLPSDVPYNGTGRLHGRVRQPLAWTAGRCKLPNFMAFQSDNFVRDPVAASAHGPTRPPAAPPTPAARTRPTPIPIRIACSWRRSTGRPARSDDPAVVPSARGCSEPAPTTRTGPAPRANT